MGLGKDKGMARGLSVPRMGGGVTDSQMRGAAWMRMGGMDEGGWHG